MSVAFDPQIQPPGTLVSQGESIDCLGLYEFAEILGVDLPAGVRDGVISVVGDLAEDATAEAVYGCSGIQLIYVGYVGGVEHVLKTDTISSACPRSFCTVPPGEIWGRIAVKARFTIAGSVGTVANSINTAIGVGSAIIIKAFAGASARFNVQR